MAAYFSEGSDAMVELEGMVDKVGMANVLYALACISREKAEHLRSAWQDPESARVWNQDALRLEKAARSMCASDQTTA